MPKQILTCSCGHRWEHSGSGVVPADVSTICPICAAGTHTLDNPSPTELPGDPSPEESPAPLRPGEMVAGFEIVEEINRGAMGVIYKARQQALNRLVALKVIAPDRLKHPDALRRFRREVQAAALLSHPNIVTVFHTDLDGPQPYLAMEYVAGIDLLRLVKRAGRLPIIDACFYAQQAAHGLEHIFEQGLVHRDIKPPNLMVTPSPLETSTSTTGRKPRVKILDLGLARVVTAGDIAGPASSLTHAGEFLGTPDFMAPEQADDPRNADIRSDLYSLGGTLYFLLVGEVPFPGTNLMQKLRRQLAGGPPSLAEQRTDAPAPLAALVQKLMAQEPEDRFQTPAEVIEELEAIMRLPESSVPPAPRPTPAPAKPPAAKMGGTPGGAVVVQAHAGGVKALCVSESGQLLISGGMDETLRLWDPGRMREIGCVAGDVGPVEDLSLAPGAKWAASCALRLFKPDMVVQLWDLASGKERRRFKGEGHTFHAVAIAPDGRRLAAGSADRTIRIWTLDPPGSPGLCLRGHSDQVMDVSFLPGGDSLLSAGYDGTVRLWDTKTGAVKGALNAKVGRIEAVAFSDPSRRVAIAGYTLQVRQADGSFTALYGHRGPVLAVAFAADGELLLSGGSDGTVRLWRSSDGYELTYFEGHTGKVNGVAFGADGRMAFSCGADGTIRRWPLPG